MSGTEEIRERAIVEISGNGDNDETSPLASSCCCVCGELARLRVLLTGSRLPEWREMGSRPTRRTVKRGKRDSKPFLAEPQNLLEYKKNRCKLNDIGCKIYSRT